MYYAVALERMRQCLVRTLTLTVSVVVGGSCSELRPSKDEARKAFSRFVAGKSEGRIELVRFVEMGRHRKRWMGRSVDRLTFEIEIEFKEECWWAWRRSFAPGSMADFRTSPKDAWVDYRVIRRRGHRERLEGSSIFFQVEGLWVVGDATIASRVTAPVQRMRYALAALERGEEENFRSEVAGLLEEESSFMGHFESALPIDLPDPPEPSGEPRLRILGPRAMMLHVERAPEGGLAVRWYDQQRPSRSGERLSLRLYAARRVAPSEPDWPPVKAELLAESSLAGSIPWEDGSYLFSLATPEIPHGWLLLEIEDIVTTRPDGKRVEDASWFQFSIVGAGLRNKAVNDDKETLMLFCDAVGASPSQWDLLLARLLVKHDFLLAAARSLELRAAQGEQMPGELALLARIYRLLGRDETSPREEPFPDQAAMWSVRLPWDPERRAAPALESDK